MKTARDSAMMRVVEVTQLSPSLKRFKLAPVDGTLLPPAGPGAHVQLKLRSGERLHSNAYSLVSAPGERSFYEIIVRRVDDSRGGSMFLHEMVAVGTVLDVSTPQNFFPLERSAIRHLLIAGGIGITPFLSYLPALSDLGRPFELHYCARSDEVDQFGKLFEGFESVYTYTQLPGQQLNFDDLLSAQPLGTHLYVCGPGAMIDEVLDIARRKGWPASTLHAERFGTAQACGGKPFTVYLCRTGIDIDVPADASILDTLEAAGIAVPCLCRGGACGQCRTTVVDGDIEHHDHVLSASERATGDQIMVCVSRARHDRIVLDL